VQRLGRTQESDKQVNSHTRDPGVESRTAEIEYIAIAALG